MKQSLRGTILRVLERGRLFGLGIGLFEDIDKDDTLTETDRAFLTRWLDSADDAIWLGIIDTGRPADVFPHYTFPYLVRFALRINRRAESGRFGGDVVFEAQRQRHRRLLDLADKAAELANFFRVQARSSYLLKEYEKELRSLPELIANHDALDRFLRKSAGPAPKPTVIPPRQDRRKGRTGLRKRRLFITLMSDCLTMFYDQKADDRSHIASLTAFARIECPDVKLATIEKALEPTTRDGRRQKREPGVPRRRGDPDLASVGVLARMLPTGGLHAHADPASLAPLEIDRTKR
jgi:hypothetical protein